MNLQLNLNEAWVKRDFKKRWNWTTEEQRKERKACKGNLQIPMAQVISRTLESGQRSPCFYNPAYRQAGDGYLTTAWSAQGVWEETWGRRAYNQAGAKSCLWLQTNKKATPQSWAFCFFLMFRNTGWNHASVSASLFQESYLFMKMFFSFSLLTDNVIDAFPQYLHFSY